MTIPVVNATLRKQRRRFKLKVLTLHWNILISFTIFTIMQLTAISSSEIDGINDEL